MNITYKNLRFAHLAHDGLRAYLIINQGLDQLNLAYDTDRDYIVNNDLIKKSSNFLERLNEYDVIFVGISNYNHLLNQKKLWSKVIWYDFNDTQNLDQEGFEKSCIYFKRSISSPNRLTINSLVNHIDYCVLEQYMIPKTEKTLDVACLFDENKYLGRRTRLVNQLKISNISNSLIGKVTVDGKQGRNISFCNQDFLKYIDILASAKIVFTDFPEYHDGDNRTWEALASNSLVFRDITNIKSKLPLIDGVHYIGYNAGDVASINDAIVKAKYFLKHNDEREKIAKSCFNFVKNHHMARDRVKFMIDRFMLSKVKFL